jgi:hypothetical protein
MKKFNNFLNENTQNDTIKSSDGINVPKDAILDMVGNMLSGKNKNINDLEVGKNYLNKSTHGNSPVKVLSLTNPVSKNNDHHYEPGKNIDKTQKLSGETVFVQTINKTDDGNGVLGGTSSNGVAIPKKNLEELPKNYNYMKDDIKELISKYKKSSNREKTDIYQYILHNINITLSKSTDNNDKIKKIDYYLSLNISPEINNKLNKKKQEIT